MPFTGHHHSQEWRDKMKIFVGNNHANWKGDNIGYSALHNWIRRHLVKPDLCEKCNLVEPKHVACVTGVYDRDFKNWRWWCVRCHMNHDGNVEKMLATPKKISYKDMSDRICSICHSDKTYIMKNGRPHWRLVNGRWICQKCNDKRRYHKPLT